jgi:predicted DCC family thiol-disulfide oxidoreductase YuxK
MLFLYDGLCGFCNRSVQWLLRHDRADQFRFAAQQSDAATEVLLRHRIHRDEMLKSNSVYLVTGWGTDAEQLLQRSDVMMQSLLALGGFWKFLGCCLRAMPRFLRDAGYTLVARKRFRLAGRYNTCPIPTATERGKFLGVRD